MDKVESAPPGLAAEFTPEQPWPMPALADCSFYHSMDYPDGETVAGPWDIRGRFDAYVGGYPLTGKSVLDVGTSSGFLAFSAEQRGARVTAIDARYTSEFDPLPFRDALSYRNRSAWAAQLQSTDLAPRRNSFWYGWHKFKSGAAVHYLPLARLPFWQQRFDVVIAGAIVEHLADPVSAIGAFAKLANEAVIVAFTPVHDSDDLSMHALNGWAYPEFNQSWWELSRGLYRRVFDNVGFDVEFATASAILNPDATTRWAAAREHIRPTIVARRRR